MVVEVRPEPVGGRPTESCGDRVQNRLTRRVERVEERPLILGSDGHGPLVLGEVEHGLDTGPRS